MSSFLCLFTALTCASTTIAKATLGDLFNAFTSWIVSSVSWLLSAVGGVLDATGEPGTVVNAAGSEFTTLLTLAPLLLLLGLLVATLQALRHGDSAALWRVYLGVAPASVAAVFLARPLALVVLTAIDQLTSAASAHDAAGLATVSSAVLTLNGVVPAFGTFLLAGLVVLGSMLLWCELLLRSVVLTLLLVLVPVIVPLSVFPALRRAGWRLAETFLALAASKFFIAIVLALGLGELAGGGATSVVMGVVTLLLACAAPFVLLRFVPHMEQAALHGLEGLRQRAVHTVVTAPNSPAGAAVSAMMPTVPPPPAPERGEDLGFPMWEPGPEVEMPATDGERPEPPVGTPRRRGGHVAYYADEGGPVVGWHFDE